MLVFFCLLARSPRFVFLFMDSARNAGRGNLMCHSDFVQKTGLALSECQQECSADVTCMQFRYHPASFALGQMCRLHSTTVSASPTPVPDRYSSCQPGAYGHCTADKCIVYTKLGIFTPQPNKMCHQNYVDSAGSTFAECKHLCMSDPVRNLAAGRASDTPHAVAPR